MSTPSHPAMPGPRVNRDVLHCMTLLTSILAFALVQREVPDPYLDEIFHIPQTQRYYDEDFESWDPAITTPPGLYLLSAIPLMTVHIPCTPPILRSTNLIFTTVVIPFLLSLIISTLSKTSSRTDVLRHLFRPSKEALVISAFPLIFFFGNLYYTDVASLAGVLGAWALALRGRHWFASLVGIWSMTVRQTNVIWLAFILATSLIQLVKDEEDKADKEDSRTVEADPYIAQLGSIGQIIRAVLKTIDILSKRPRKAINITLPYLFPFGGFLAFIKWNGGIVLGHKDRHEPFLHLPQVLYFIAFATIMLLPSLLSEGVGAAIFGTLSYSVSSPTRISLSAILGVGILIVIHKYTIFHPFLLADNRHYVFYLLRWVLIPYPAVRYQLTPLYIYAFWAWLWRLRRKATLFWSLGFLLCTALVLVPSPLIEPRYFLVPTIILRLQLCRSPWIGFPKPDASAGPSGSEKHVTLRGAGAESRTDWHLIAEYAWYTLINLGTVALFLGKKFRWEGWEGWMRFMW